MLLRPFLPSNLRIYRYSAKWKRGRPIENQMPLLVVCSAQKNGLSHDGSVCMVDWCGHKTGVFVDGKWPTIYTIHTWIRHGYGVYIRLIEFWLRFGIRKLALRRQRPGDVEYFLWQPVVFFVWYDATKNPMFNLENCGITSIGRMTLQ